MAESNDLTQNIIEGIHDRKGRGVTIVDLSKIEGAATDGFIICEGSSTMQVASIADNIREHVQKQTGQKPYNYDGYKNSQWIVIDYGSLLVHVFLPETRELYNLEELWSDAPIEHVADLD